MKRQLLNPYLYKALESRFGLVKIANYGTASVASLITDTDTGRHRTLLIVKGEHYRVSCPRCSDTRFRLYINHLWGTRDPWGGKNMHRIFCHNEDCYRQYEDRRELYDQLISGHPLLKAPKLQKGVVIDPNADIEPPGGIMPLHLLSPSHPANRYLAFRGFDPEELSETYGVGYCTDSKYFWARQKIYIPVTDAAGRLKTWQVRCIGDPLGDEPKYITAPNSQKSTVLYNFEQACQYQTIVGVEGPTSSWAVGPMAVGTLGFPPSEKQFSLIVGACEQDRKFVALFDPDVQEAGTQHKDAYDRLMGRLRQHLGKERVAGVVLPEEDPGAFNPAFTLPFIKQEAAKQGVEISWDKVPAKIS